MSWQTPAELGPDWKPIVRSESFRKMQLRWGLATAVVAAASLLGLVLVVVQIFPHPSTLWSGVKLWGLTLIMAITLRHQSSVVIGAFHRPEVRGVAVSGMVGAIGLLAGVAYWKLIPAHQAFPIVPVLVSVPFSFIVGALGIPVIAADTMNNLEASAFGDIREERRASQVGESRWTPTEGTAPIADVETFVDEVVQAVNHQWHDPELGREAASLKRGLFLAVQNQLRNQCILYGERLAALYRKDVVR